MRNKKHIEDRLGSIFGNEQVPKIILVIQFLMEQEKEKHPDGYQGVPEETLIKKVTGDLKMDEEEAKAFIYFLKSHGVMNIKKGRHYELPSYYSRNYN